MTNDSTRLAQSDAVAAVVVADRHIVAHQEDAAATGAFEILGGERIGNSAGIEPGALIFNLGSHLSIRNGVANVNELGRVAAIAVLQSIHDGFFEGQADAEALLIGKTEPGHPF